MAAFTAYMDVEVYVKPHKNISNVMSVGQAVKSGKASKNHKMKPRNNKKDRTKSKESRTWTLCRKHSHATASF
jgi:hypothetical protein